MTTSSAQSGKAHAWGWKHIFGVLFALAFLYEINQGKHNDGFLGSIWAAALDAAGLIILAWIVIAMVGGAYYGVKGVVARLDRAPAPASAAYGQIESGDKSPENPRPSVWRTIAGYLLYIAVAGLMLALVYSQVSRINVQVKADEDAADAGMSVATSEANKLAEKVGSKPKLSVADVRVEKDGAFNCAISATFVNGGSVVDREYWLASGGAGMPVTLTSARFLGEEQIQ